MANGTRADQRLVGRLPGRLHPGRRRGRPADRAVLRLLAGVHRRRRRRPRPRARCSTPASSRSSTPACWPAPTTPRAPSRWSTSCSAPEVQAALPDSMYVFPVADGVALPAGLGDVRPAPDRTRGRSTRPRSPRTATTWLREWSDVTRDDRARHERGPLTLLGLAAVPVLVLGVFFVLPVAGHAGARVLASTARFDPGAVAEVLARPAGAPGAVVHASGRPRLATALRAAARRCRRRTCCTGWRSRGRGLVRALLLVPFVLPTVVVGVAFRAAAAARPGRSASSASTARRRRSSPGLVFFNVAVVIRAVGATWESPRPAPGRGRGGARRRPGAGLPHRHAAGAATGDRVGGERGVPVLRDGVRRRAHPRRAALLLGRDRDLPAHHQPARPAGRGRAVDRCSWSWSRRCWSWPAGCAPYRTRRPARTTAPPRPGAARRPAAARWRRRCSLVLVAAPIATLVVGSLRVDDGWSLDNYRALTDRGVAAGAAGPGDRRAGQLAAHRGRRHLDVAAARRAGRGRGHPPVADPRRAPAARGCSTASSCCRSASRR